ncbi:Gaa1-like protein, partial [Blyttiomyces helicus]
YVVGVAWLLALPLRDLHDLADVDENALLPGQTNKYFSGLDDYFAFTTRQKLTEVISQSWNTTGNAAFIESELNGLGLDASTQNFIVTGEEGPVLGANVHGVFKAPRGDGTESIVISAPWICRNGELNINGIGYLMAFAKFVTKFSFWSKDFIFLVTHPSPAGTQAWLDAYHGEEPKIGAALQFDPLENHAGVIQEAINLEFGGNDDYAALGLYVEGLNGQLSNADLITTFVRCAQYEGLPVRLHDIIPPRSFHSDLDHYLFSMKSIISYMKEQALGFPNDGHALFPRYKIEALTVIGLRDMNSNLRLTGESIGRTLESTLRSLNNLLERLHHAYWFYIMPTSDSYIPISKYIPPVLLLAATLVLKSISLWWETGNLTLEYPIAPKRVPGTKYMAREEAASSFTRRVRPIYLPIVTLVGCAMGGWALYRLAPSVGYLMAERLIHPIYIIGSVLASVQLYVYILLPLTQRMMEGTGIGTATRAPAWQTLKCMVCAAQGMSLMALATLNPSLSILLALPSVPAFLFAAPTRSAIVYMQRWTALTVASPVGLLGLLAVAEGVGVAEGLVLRSFDAWRVYGSWLAPFVFLLYWPLNLAAHVVLLME